MKALREAKAWAVVYPNGRLAGWSVQPTRVEAMQAATEGMMGFREYDRLGNLSDRWSYCYRRGNRLVRVRVLAVGEETK